MSFPKGTVHNPRTLISGMFGPWQRNGAWTGKQLLKSGPVCPGRSDTQCKEQTIALIKAGTCRKTDDLGL
jgi:hypothetical protein